MYQSSDDEDDAKSIVLFMRIHLRFLMTHCETSEQVVEQFIQKLHEISDWDLETLAFHTANFYPSFKENLTNNIINSGKSGLFDD